MRTISYDDYLRFLGLVTLAQGHVQALRDIERSALQLLEDEELGHVSDLIWGGDRTPDQVLQLLEISVNSSSQK